MESLKALERLLTAISVHARCFTSGDEFLDFCSLNPGSVSGCLILDLIMPGMGGLEVMSKMATLGFIIPAIMMSGYGDIPTAVQAMRMGAIDFIQKPFSPQNMIERVQEGLRINQETQRKNRLITQLLQQISQLTPREKEIYRCMLTGSTTKDIASQFKISTNTVDSHRAHIARKMGADSTSQLIVMGLQVIDKLN